MCLCICACLHGQIKRKLSMHKRPNCFICAWCQQICQSKTNCVDTPSLGWHFPTRFTRTIIINAHLRPSRENLRLKSNGQSHLQKSVCIAKAVPMHALRPLFIAWWLGLCCLLWGVHIKLKHNARLVMLLGCMTSAQICPSALCGIQPTINTQGCHQLCLFQMPLRFGAMHRWSWQCRKH